MTVPLKRLSVGIVLPSRVSATRAFAIDAERLGFDYLACGEHVLGQGECHNGLISLSHAAAVTTRIELLTAVTLTPLYPPALLAKMTATLDVLSQGRLNVGLGVGGEYPAEFSACGVSMAERGVRTTEALQVLRALWSGAGFDGAFTQVHGGQFTPLPHRPPPIWVSGRSEAAMRRAALHADFWLPYLMTPEAFARSCRRVCELADDTSRAIAGHPTPFVHLLVAVAESSQAAQGASDAFLRAHYRDDVVPAVRRHVIAGSPAQVRARLQEYADAGAAGVIVSLVCPDDQYHRMAQMLADAALGEPGNNS